MNSKGLPFIQGKTHALEQSWVTNVINTRGSGWTYIVMVTAAYGSGANSIQFHGVTCAKMSRNTDDLSCGKHRGK